MNTATSTLTGSNTLADAAGRAHQMVDNVATKVDNVATKAAPALQTATDKAHATIDTVADAGKSAAEWVSTNGADLADRTGALLDGCATKVRARPFFAVAGALAIGYLVGRVMR